MTTLESVSAIASRYQLSYNEAAAMANAGYDDRLMFGPKVTLDPAKVLRARK